jgi:phage terminase large subunit GpA-like protein
MVAPSSFAAGARPALRPPPKLSLSEWADRHFRLSAESAAEPGKWTTLPYQRGILDAITDPAVERVSVIKSARVGYTKCINAAVAYFMAQDPCPMMIVQPTEDGAEGYSKEEIVPMLRDVPALAGLVKESSVKTSSNTTTLKSFPGGVIDMVGATSGRGFRRKSRRVVFLDETDGYPPSAGGDGDPIKLAEKRAATYWNRKIVAGSTPRTAGASRIHELFLAGDQRRYYVPCPHCNHFDFLRFSVRGGDGAPTGGHVMWWPKEPAERPEEACFRCSRCGCVIEESAKDEMVARGEWRAAAPGNGTTVQGRLHASFHIWAAYSPSPDARWGAIASEFVAVRKKHEELKTFVNNVLGETWQERGEAPEWERLYQRREPYTIGTVPAGVQWLTCGVDVQKDRLVPEVVGWGSNKESWSILWEEIHGDTALLAGEHSPWVKLRELLDRSFLGADGRVFTILMMAVDGGWQTAATSTQVVYAWGREQDRSRVMITKGVPGAGALIEAATPVDVTIGGRRIQRGYRVWPVHVDGAKGELYGWLRLEHVEGEPPPGYCHFPEHPAEFFRQLTAEHLVSVVNRRTHRAKLEWQCFPNRENHALDARVLARVAAARLGIDRIAAAARQAAPAPTPPAVQPSSRPEPVASSPPRSGPRGWFGGGGRSPRGWHRPRR